MSLVFHYTMLSTRQPIWTLFGRIDRPYPLLHVAIVGPTGRAIELAQIDSGSDETVFPEVVAHDIGLDLTTAPTLTFSSAGLGLAVVRYAEVKLCISDGREYREWPARVGFTSAPIKRSLLGFAGFLQFFSTLLDGEREEVQLTVNNLYPGT